MNSLDYEPTSAARSVLVEQDGAVIRVIVSMRGLYAPVPSLLSHMDLIGLVLLPFWWIASLLVRSCLRLPKPPRAVFEVSDEGVAMHLRDPFTGDLSTARWPRGAVVEARTNRFGPGLWVDVTGHVKETYLQDLPRETIERLEAALAAAFATHPPRIC